MPVTNNRISNNRISPNTFSAVIPKFESRTSDEISNSLMNRVRYLPSLSLTPKSELGFDTNWNDFIQKHPTTTAPSSQSLYDAELKSRYGPNPTWFQKWKFNRWWKSKEGNAFRLNKWNEWDQRETDKHTAMMNFLVEGKTSLANKQYLEWVNKHPTILHTISPDYTLNWDDVRTVQQFLNNAFKANLTVDGKYGPATLAAIQAVLLRKDIHIPDLLRENLESFVATRLNQIAPVSTNTSNAEPNESTGTANSSTEQTSEPDESTGTANSSTEQTSEPDGNTINPIPLLDMVLFRQHDTPEYRNITLKDGNTYPVYITTNLENWDNGTTQLNNHSYAIDADNNRMIALSEDYFTGAPTRRLAQDALWIPLNEVLRTPVASTPTDTQRDQYNRAVRETLKYIPGLGSATYLVWKNFFKRGGKMNKINNFQLGGMISQQNIQQQIKQLVQAVAAGDQQAVEQVKKIMEAAQKGDLQALLLAQLIEQEIQAIQKAQKGAKINYLRQLKGKCPEGEELVYFKKGGLLECGCLKKQNGAKLEKTNAIDEFKKRRRKA